jgi:YggT family protein
MFIVGNFLNAIAITLKWVLWTYMWILIARAVITWVGPDPYNPIVQFLTHATEPVLRRVRRLIPIPGQFDFAPLLVILGLLFLQLFLVESIRDLAWSLKR